jgi:hypothetical protein
MMNKLWNERNETGEFVITQNQKATKNNNNNNNNTKKQRHQEERH